MKLGRKSVGRKPRGFDIAPRPRGTVSLPKDSNPFYGNYLTANELRQNSWVDENIRPPQNDRKTPLFPKFLISTDGSCQSPLRYWERK